MHIARRFLALLFLAVTGAAGAAGPAEEAVGRDGQKWSGELERGTDGRLRFRTGGRNLPVNDLALIRFPASANPPLRAPVLHRIQLREGQSLTGELLRADAEKLHLRTAWADSLAVPRAAVERVSVAGGFVPLFTDDFEKDLTAWSLAGEPARSEGPSTSGRFALALNAAGQGATFRLKEPLTAGRVGVNFLDPGKAAGLRWFVELSFPAKADGPAKTVRVDVAGPGDVYAVRAPGKADYAGQVPKAGGWRRLTVECTPSSLLICVDEYVLWSQKREGPGGELRGVRIACEAADANGGTAKGEVRFDDFAVALAAESLAASPPGGDSTQDEVRLRDGDQLFGKVTQLDWRAVTLEAKFGTRTFPWSEVESAAFRRGEALPAETDGEHVRLRIRGNDGGRDEIEGVVRSLDARGLRLRHASLGDLTIPRSRLAELRPLFTGKRVVLAAGPHHLGAKARPRFRSPRPEGTSLRRNFTLNGAADQAALVVEAAFLSPDGPKTEVRLNGRRVADLNRFIDKESPEPATLRVPLPSDALVSGSNVVELRQVPDSLTGRVGDCEVCGLRVEIPEAR